MIDEDSTATFNDDLTVGTLYFDDYWDTPAGETKALYLQRIMMQQFQVTLEVASAAN